MSLPLPPELVDIVAEHLRYDKRTLKSCALVARTWTIPCQRVLFHKLYLWSYLPVIHLPAHLTRYPHLQRLILRVQMCTELGFSESERVRDNYLSSLAALFPLMPRLTSLDIAFERNRSWDTHDQRFFEAFRAFARTSESLTALTIRDILDEVDFQQMFSILEGSNIKRVALETEPHGSDAVPVAFFDPTLTIVHLPAIELLRVDLDNVLRLCGALNFWLCQWPTMFPHLKHFEVVINEAEDIGLLFHDILQPAALRLESFRLELMRHCLREDDELPSDALFEGLRFKHFKLCISDIATGRLEAPALLINWFSSMFRHLADSGTPIHFTELTFTFSRLKDLESTSREWEALDQVLSHAAFAGVQRIRFEDGSDCGNAQVTDQMHPELASLVRRTMPSLASRGVLCFS
ncbi:hypothetical protein BDZ89DRAFT_1164959 [Hymenopellis radicata]|nr:hypothetical protein BDZ89DRAFT_1164959 [Hymenopellis radicata]